MIHLHKFVAPMIINAYVDNRMKNDNITTDIMNIQAIKSATKKVSMFIFASAAMFGTFMMPAIVISQFS